MKTKRFAIQMCAAAALGLWCVGCGGDDIDYNATIEKDTEGTHEEHSHEGPHGGHLIELEEAYHAELVDKHEGHQITIYILDAQVKDAVAIEAADVTIKLFADGKQRQFQLPASPVESDADGKASRFELQDEELFDLLHDNKARLYVTAGGKEYVGDIEHHDHDDGETHEDDHDDDAKHKESEKGEHKDGDDA